MNSKIILLSCILFVSCGLPEQQSALQNALTFYASFDYSTEADFALGVGHLHTRTAWNKPDSLGYDERLIGIDSVAGKFAGALRFRGALPDGHRVFYPTKSNVAYKDTAWGGTVSYWLNINPNTDLPGNYSDPVQFFGRRFNDAAIWQDFTGDKPRDLRIGMFPDGPDNANTSNVPEEQQPVFRFVNPDWKRGEWHHVVITWNNINSGRADAICTLYIDGRRIGEIKDKRQRFTWNLDRAVINVGVNYVGLIDDLAIFSRSLTNDEVQYLHGLSNGVKGLQ